jgi:hypothetical protein
MLGAWSSPGDLKKTQTQALLFIARMKKLKLKENQLKEKHEKE